MTRPRGSRILGRTARRGRGPAPSVGAVCLLAVLGLVLAICTACGSASGGTSSATAPSTTSATRPAGDGPVTIRVPEDAATISSAVAVARTGDLVLVSPGVYKETVRVSTPGLTIRGTDRNTVIIDGEVLRANGIVVTAGGTTIANLTVRQATGNGVLVTGMSDATGGLAKGSDGYTKLDPSKFPPVQGFHIDHVTSYNNGLYGIYAFDAQYGLIENSYTSGMADSGIYVGQCKPCHTVVRGNVAERNAVGYEGTNAGPDLTVTGNRFVGNRVGATTDSDYQEAYLPQAGSTLVGNVVAANTAADTPVQADGGFGVGLGIAGGTQNLLSRNLIQANSTAGLIITSAEDLGPKDNRILDNRFDDNGVDVAYSPTARGPGSGNCLAGNTLRTTAPQDLARSMSCAAPTSTTAPSSVAAPSASAAMPAVQAPPGIPFTEVKPPPAGLPSLPAPTGPAAPWAVTDVPVIDPATVAMPAAGLLAEQSGIRW